MYTKRGSMKFIILSILLISNLLAGTNIQVQCDENQTKLVLVDTNGVFVEYMQTNNEVKLDTATLIFESNTGYILHRKHKEKVFVQKQNIYYLKYFK